MRLGVSMALGTGFKYWADGSAHIVHADALYAQVRPSVHAGGHARLQGGSKLAERSNEIRPGQLWHGMWLQCQESCAALCSAATLEGLHVLCCCRRWWYHRLSRAACGAACQMTSSLRYKHATCIRCMLMWWRCACSVHSCAALLT